MSGWERRRLGALSAAAIVAGNMIGAGVFTTSGFALASLGDARWVLWAWAVGGVVALCGALSYGGLAARIPRSGGEYTFLAELVHPAAGFVAGWVSLLAGFTAPMALAALVFDSYLGAAFAVAIPEGWAGGAAILLVGLLHGLRLRAGVVTQNFAVAVKLVAIAAFVVWGAQALPNDLPRAAPQPLAWGAFGVSLVWISFAFSGWNGAVYLAGEIRNPEQNIPRSLWMTTLLVALIYLGLNAVFLGSAPEEALAGRPDIAAVAAGALGGPALRQAVALLVALALFTSISAMALAGPRVYAQMARDGLFPGVFSQGHDAPSAAIALQTGLALFVYLVADLVELLGYLGFTLSLSAAATVLAGAYLRWREGPERVPIPGYPWTPLVFVGFSVAGALFLVLREPAQAAVGALTALVGVPVYFWMRRRPRGARRPPTP